ncbi:rubrerythrin family protein [Mobilitalea sibirica]|uniref:Rubrerythrin family protein n=1 Tax=Mobilitalea sibirica TaxID=1462919 RepID=A0A8J7KZK8_9FIRM|nr:ferritin family protein [Mobilitalea sibirica]MBH1940398.1 rubrerythrin family protein [Mobilitalea sibirica]
MDQMYDNEFYNSNTYANIKDAFQEEASAYTRYKIYAMRAREEGFMQIGDIMDETARNEKVHASIWLKLLEGNETPSTYENLRTAYTIENHEWSIKYLEYALEARREGYPHIAERFEQVAAVERHHDSRMRKLAFNIEHDITFCKKNTNLWVCHNCGNVQYDLSAPCLCPVCGCSRAFYEIYRENY